MPGMADALTALFPSAVPLVDFVVRDDGSGPYIAVWNLEAPQPSQQEIEAVTDGDVAMAQHIKRAQVAGALLQSTEPIPLAVRASDSAGYELRNDIAETLGALIRVVAARLSVSEATLIDEIEAEITAGRDGVVFAEVPPTAETTLDRGTRRVQTLELFQMIGGYVGNV